MSDHGLLVSFGDRATEDAAEGVLAAIAALSAAPPPGMRNLHAAYASVLVDCDPLGAEMTAVEAAVRSALEDSAERPGRTRRTVEIPVCYAPSHAPDLEDVAIRLGLTTDDVVGMHSGAGYVVRFLGFTPGFPYLAGLPEALEVPRLAVPRKTVPSGSVAIAGGQAGIYPSATPGGWRLIGRTPLELFRAARRDPALLAPGDSVRFVPIDVERFGRLAHESASWR